MMIVYTNIVDTSVGMCCVFSQILMSVVRTLTTVLRTATILLAVISASAMMDTHWTLTSTLAMVGNYSRI